MNEPFISQGPACHFKHRIETLSTLSIISPTQGTWGPGSRLYSHQRNRYLIRPPNENYTRHFLTYSQGFKSIPLDSALLILLLRSSRYNSQRGWDLYQRKEFGGPSDRTQAGSREPHLSSSHKSKPPSNIIQEECFFFSLSSQNPTTSNHLLLPIRDTLYSSYFIPSILYPGIFTY